MSAHDKATCRCSECKWKREGWARMNKPKAQRTRMELLSDMIQEGLVTAAEAADLLRDDVPPPLLSPEERAVMKAPAPKRLDCGCPGTCYMETAVREMRATTGDLQAHRRIGRRDDDFAVSLRYATLMVPMPGKSIVIDNLGGPPVFRLESPTVAPKCPPSCSPMEPCKRTGCTAAEYLLAEARIASLAERYNLVRKEPPKRPRPEFRSIGAAGLTFSRWNGRAP